MTPSWWRGRRVFITGHTGFKGSWLCLLLDELGASIVGYSLPAPTSPSLFNEAKVADEVEGIEADIRDLSRLRGALKEAKPEIVLHLAAQPLVRESYRDPVETYSTNVIGTVNVLEAVRATDSVRAVVNVTTDKCYENREWVWGYRENEPMGGHDPYSSSKGCAELVSSAYRRSFFEKQNIALATARAGNVIGGGDWAADRLIPDCVRALSASKPILIRNPHSIRPWQHVLEPLTGYLRLAERLVERGQEAASAWNFGPSDDDAKPVQWIVERMAALWGAGARWENQPGDHPHEASYLKLDTSKARTKLGWRPRTNLETALQWIVQWHRRHNNHEDAGQLCREQIKQFLSMENN